MASQQEAASCEGGWRLGWAGGCMWRKGCGACGIRGCSACVVLGTVAHVVLGAVAHARLGAVGAVYPTPPHPPTGQVTSFFTLDDFVATLSLRDLLLINLCADILIPDPHVLPGAVFGSVENLNAITFSRCVWGSWGLLTLCVGSWGVDLRTRF